ncbi:hypothetical protein [uncultured Rhodoblastus sp.]|uniref:hypothetical protein n=1 Tax=uncultured Rhodoblastus sp. TaxID=543037 RepID=UPI0025EDCE70|nr:hypothetical protein [uncultured Rhodoblastus sp.]
MGHIERLAFNQFQLFQRQRRLPTAGAANDDEGRRSAKDGVLRIVEGNRLVEQMDDRPFRIQIAQRLRFLFGLGGIAGDDFILVNDSASQEARFSVIVIDDYFQHEGADVVIVTEEAKDQAVRVIEPRAVEFAMSSARQLPHLSRAKVATGNRGCHLAIGGLYPRRVQVCEL